MSLLLPPYALLSGAAAMAEPPYAFANAEAETLVAAMTAAPNGARKALIDTFIGALKTAGVWAKLDVMWVLAAHDEQAARLNWVSPGSFTLTAVNAPTFTADRGFAGNGTSSYLDTGWDAATDGIQYTRDSCFLSCYAISQGGSNVPQFGIRNSFNASLVVRTGTSGRGRANAGSDVAAPSGGALPMHLAARRNVSTDQTLLRDGTQVATGAQASTALSTTDFAFLQAGAFSAAQVSGGSLGAYLDDTEAAAFYAAWNAYMVAVGADT